VQLISVDINEFFKTRKVMITEQLLLDYLIAMNAWHLIYQVFPYIQSLCDFRTKDIFELKWSA